MSKNHFHCIVIGSGPAGQRAAIQCAKLGKSVLVIEKDGIGGSCFHSGTIPSKTLREAVIRESNRGLSAKDIFKLAMKSKDQLLVEECRILENQLSRNKVDYLQGFAEIHSKNSLKVKTSSGTLLDFDFDNLFLAVGSSPGPNPDWVPRDSRVYDSDQILGLSNVPKKMLLIGAGVIGCEYASIFSKMGIEVTLLDRREKILRGLDPDIQQALCQAFAKDGMKLLLGLKDFKISSSKDSILLESPSTSDDFDVVLACMGRLGQGLRLKLADLGIEVNDKGFIVVNENYQSSLKNIYAVGDVIGPPSLAASGSEQGRLAALHACTGAAPAFSKFFPVGIYTIPEVSTVGKGEEELQNEKASFVVGKARYAELARGKILGDEDGYLKMMVSKTDRKILGIQIMGTSASELVHIGQMAMALGGSLDFFVQNIFNYPTLAEAYKVAALNAHNQLREKENAK